MYNRSRGMLDLSLLVTHVVVSIMSSLNYIMTCSFSGKTFWLNSPPSIICAFMSEILCERDRHEIFYNKRCVSGKKCDHYGNIALFHHKYPIDINDQSLSI